MSLLTQGIVSLIIIWIAVPICIYVMKRVSPEQWKVYAVYAVFVAVLFTAFAFFRINGM